MNDRAGVGPHLFSIAAVERDTGLPKDTLRIWEKRYNFPQPDRDAFGERVYSIEQLEKLRLIKRLLDGGHRPGKIMPLSIMDLVKLADSDSDCSRINVAPDSLDELNGYMGLIRQRDPEEFLYAMSRLALLIGLNRFVLEIVAPMNVMVADARARGYFELFEEHIYTETVQVVLRNALNTLPPARTGPRVLLTTLPGELHGITLLMAQCILALEGAQCVSLGTQMPVYDIVLAAKAQNINIVALSFSVAQGSPAMLDALADLRSKLPADVEIWCGGSSSVLSKRVTEDFVWIPSFKATSEAIADWCLRNKSNCTGA